MTFPPIPSRRPPLRLGLLTDSRFARAWIIRLAKKLAALDGIEIALWINAEKPAPSAALTDAYAALERRLLNNVPDLRQVSDLRAALPEIPVVSPAETETIAAQALDVVVCFQDEPPRAPLPARLGTWSWNDISPAAGFQETYRRAPLTVCELSARLPNGETKILRRAVFASDWLSATRNRHRVYLKAAATLLWALKKLALQDGELWDESADEEPIRPPRSFSPPQAAALVFKQAARALEKKFRPQETWLVFAEREEDGLPPKQTERKKLLAPPGFYWADPVAFAKDGATYLFVEEYVRAQRRGRIVCLTLDSEARVVAREVALERPYHLSYPFVFEREGELYMIPETAARRAIEVYHCIKFPARWELCETLMPDVYAVDSTLLKRGGRWWLFANLMSEPGASSWDELHLFYAEDPLSAEWIPHPLNPLISDARAARPAGPFFEREGVLYRPSQDSSRRYGYAVNLNRVDVLNEREYAETRVEKILPRGGLLATHTYSRANGWVFTDGVTRKPEEAQ